ncbi:MAG: hypothetical protein OQK67_02475 [Chlorobium sp.]|nr:hypothetical protein [Chlorobium sp.]MCW8814781.1 hypothetical protein [Chlorobium sp.]MCW8820138.1 hypothetical protein [Ignavibacteriaceae bacterium]
MKTRILKKKHCELNVCCGKNDGNKKLYHPVVLVGKMPPRPLDVLRGIKTVHLS